MDDTTRMQMRRLLKRFGVKADEMIISHLARNPDAGPLKLRITLEEVNAAGEGLYFQVEGTIGEE